MKKICCRKSIENQCSLDLAHTQDLTQHTLTPNVDDRWRMTQAPSYTVSRAEEIANSVNYFTDARK